MFELLVVDRRVGHHLILRPVVDLQFALNKLDDRRVPAGIRERQMPGSRLSAQQQRHDLEARVVRPRDGLGDGREVVQEVLQADRQAESGPLQVACAVVCLGQVEAVTGEPRFVDAIACDFAVHRGHDAAVARGPLQGLAVGHARSTHPARQSPDVGPRVFEPIHAPADKHGAFAGSSLTRPQDACAHVLSFLLGRCHSLASVKLDVREPRPTSIPVGAGPNPPGPVGHWQREARRVDGGGQGMAALRGRSVRGSLSGTI